MEIEQSLSGATETIKNLFKRMPLSDDEMMISLGLFTRTGVLAKILFIDELYNMIRNVPGDILEFGCWAGQNLVLFENMRAIYEPFYPRRIVGFDTFKGYVADGTGQGLDAAGNYVMPDDYPDYIAQLLQAHEANNVAAPGRCRVVPGDAAVSITGYLRDNPPSVVALAYFDMAQYEPTLKCLEAIKPHLVRGAVIMLDEYNDPKYPGETAAFNEVFGASDYQICNSRFAPGRAIIRLA